MSPEWFSSPGSEAAPPGAGGQSGMICGSSAKAPPEANSDRPMTKRSDGCMAEVPDEEEGPLSVQGTRPQRQALQNPGGWRSRGPPFETARLVRPLRLILDGETWID